LTGIPACPCGEPAVVILPGSYGERLDRKSIGFWLQRPSPDRFFCLACARTAGFPWGKGEKRRQRHQAPEKTV
jgi:hypothetical protein